MSTAAQYEVEIKVDGIESLKQLEQYTTKYTEAIRNAQKQTASFGKPANDATKAAREMSRQLGGVGLQVQDVAVQLQGGASVTRVLAQQLPQLASNFGTVGIAIGTVAGLLIPFIANYVDLDKILRTGAQTIADTATALDTATKSQDEANRSVDSLKAKYGEFAASVRAANQAVAELDARKALQLTADTAAELIKQFREVETIAKGRNVLLIADDAGGLAKKLGISRAEAEKLTRALQDVRDGANLSSAVTVLNDIGQKALNGDTSMQGLGRSILEVAKNAAALVTARDYADQFTLSLTNLAQMAQTATTWLKAEWTSAFNKGLEESKNRIDAYLPQVEKLRKEREQLIADRQGYGGLWSEEERAASDAAIANLDRMIAQQGKNTEAYRKQQAAAREAAQQLEAFKNAIDANLPPSEQLTAKIAEMEANFARFRDQLSPVEVDAYTAAITRLKLQQEGMTFEGQWAKMAEEIENATTALAPFQALLTQVGQTLTEGFSSGLADAFIQFAEGTKSAKEAFKDFAKSMLKELTAMIIKSLLLYAIQAAMGMILPGQSALRPMLGVGTVYGARPEGEGGGLARSGGDGGVTSFAGRIMPSTNSIAPKSVNSGITDQRPLMQVQITNNVNNANVSATQDSEGRLRIMIDEHVSNSLTRGGNKISQAFERGYGVRRAGR